MTFSRSRWGANSWRPTLLSLAILAACAGGSGDSPQRPLAEVLAEVSPGIMDIPGVVMVYESALKNGDPCIKVGVRNETPELRERIGTRIEGYPVVIVETGAIEPK